MAVPAAQSRQFDFSFDEYTYGAEQALSEREPSLEELEAAIKETTPSRPSMQYDYGRTNSEPRPLGDVIDESEKMLPRGSSLRHTKGRLEDSPNLSQRPTTPSRTSPQDKNTPPSTDGSHPTILQGEPTSPSVRAANFSKRELKRTTHQEKSIDETMEQDETNNEHIESYADVVKHDEAHSEQKERAKNFTDEVKQDATNSEPREHNKRSIGMIKRKEVPSEHKERIQSSATAPKQEEARVENIASSAGEVKHEEAHTETNELTESYADVVKHEAPADDASVNAEARSSDSVDAKYEASANDTPVKAKVNGDSHVKEEHEDANTEQESSEIKQQNGTPASGVSYASLVEHQSTSATQSDADVAHDKTKHEEDFADTATAVSDDDALSGLGKDESPRSPHKKAHRKQSSKSLNAKSGKVLQSQEDEHLTPGTLVYENYHSQSGTNLTSVALEPEYDMSLSQRENKAITSEPPEERAKAEKSTLVSGRRAGAGWARSAIRWAPLNVPLQRRLQTLAVLAHSLSIAGLLAFFFFLCAIPVFWPILVPYLVYVLLSKAPTNGKLTHRSEWVRRSKFWSLFASYFPARLHRTVELEPTRKYIFGYHPHGIISHGAFAAFTTEALGFAQLFPGITNTLLTLDSNFRVPIYRDWALRLGLASVSRESCENLLSKGGPNGEGMGRGITIVIGGARESLDAKPGTLNLVLAKRKGFVKLAVRTGADLVPVLAFGENDMYEQVTSETHPWIHKGQLLLKKFMGFTVPLFHARGIFNYDVGIMPYRRPINIVVGRPIKTVQNKKPDADYVDKLHKEYTDQLLHIWEEWKDVFAPQRNCELQIVE